jgi:phosphopantothenoylcysteine decarboxylase/phosphopantothenate--cysteine ligase
MKYSGKKILVGITGGIAAYKACELIRHFVKHGAEVRAVMTQHAAEFVTPLTIETLSNNKVVTEIFPHGGTDQNMSRTHHIEIANWPDVFLIVPASANIVGKIAGGLADEIVSTVVMACPKPVLLALAMNDKMYLNPIVQKNIHSLKSYGYHIIEPETGFLAEGYEGVGRLAELDTIIWSVEKQLIGDTSLKGRKILVTAGPTHEALDPVRILTNHSSGKMGYALARQAALMGADVTLISGPTHLDNPPDMNVISVTSADEMAEAVRGQFPKNDTVIMAAAVADFKPLRKESKKIKKSKSGGTVNIECVPTVDILSAAAQTKKNQIVVGFALETDHDVANARKKLKEKRLDLIVLNNPHEDGAGFNTDTNVVTLIDHNGLEKLPLMSKDDAARKILEKIETMDHKEAKARKR